MNRRGWGNVLKLKKESFFFLGRGFTPRKAEQSLRGMELQEKRSKKILKHTGNLFRKNLKLEMLGFSAYRMLSS